MSQPARRSLRAKAVLAAEIVAAYPGTLRALKRHDLPTAIERLRTRSNPTSPPTDVILESCRLGHAVQRTLTALPVIDSRCLMQTLVLCRLLARRGVTGTVVIGVAPGEEFGAHAWLEVEGEPVLPTGGFPRLAEL